MNPTASPAAESRQRAVHWTIDPARSGGEAVGYRIRVANDRSTRERAYRLAHRVYRGHGYVDGGSAESSACLVDSFDADPETVTLLGEDTRGRDAGTVSLYFDSSKGLPCDEIFARETAILRAAGRRIVEVGRLAITKEYQHSRILLLRMINAIFIYAVRLKGHTDFVIEVHPDHAGFYCRRIGFEVLGPPRPCPRVRGAPAILLRLDLNLYVQQMEARDLPGSRCRCDPRLWYSRFIPLSEEPRVQAILARQQRSMSPEEARHFYSA